MNLLKNRINAFSKFLILALVVALLPLSQSVSSALNFVQSAALAQEEEGRRAPPSARSSQTLSRRVYERLEEIMELRDAEDMEGANQVLAEIMEMYEDGRLNDKESLTMWQFYANIAALDERYEEAIGYQQEILAMGDVLLPEQVEDTLSMLGQLSYAIEDYRGAIDYYLRFLDVALEPGLDPYLRIASAYYTIEEYADAIPFMLEFIDRSRAMNEDIDRSTFLLLRALYTTLEQYPEALQLTREMIIMYQDKEDWEFIINLLGVLERFDEQAGFLYAMDAFGYLDSEGQVTNLAAQFFNEGFYWGSAKTLEKGLEQGIIEDEADFRLWSNIGQGYQFSREDEMSLEPLARAAELDESGDTYSRLATAYINLGRYEDAVPVFEDAFAKGDLNREDQTYLRQAQVYLNLNRFDDALEAARNAGRDERSEDAAETWIRYIENERNLYDTKERQRELYQGFFR